MMAIFGFLRIIPIGVWKWLAAITAALAAVWFVYHKGELHERGKWEALQAANNLYAAQVGQRRAEATTRVVTQYVDRVRAVRGKSETITKEVPIYVNQNDDHRCIINNGFVRLHNAAATNELPSSTSGANEAPASVALSTVAETVAENYGTCHENAAQLEALQEWVRAQEVVK
jgi:hypothetical protein